MNTAPTQQQPADALQFRHGCPPKLRTPGLHSVFITGAVFGATKRPDTSTVLPAAKSPGPTGWQQPQKTRITAATQRETYAGNELSAPAVRPGADDALALPSRTGRNLHYRDGRTELLAT